MPESAAHLAFTLKTHCEMVAVLGALGQSSGLGMPGARSAASTMEAA